MSTRKATAPPPNGAPAVGQIDQVSDVGTVSGWCAACVPPYTPRQVMILVDGQVVLRGISCDEFREDLQRAGIGDGRHGFTAQLRSGPPSAGSDAEIILRDEATGTQIGPTIHACWSIPAPRPAELEAHIDELTAEGMIEGWCWDRAAPERRVTLDILIDGALAGHTLAGIFREDLRSAGKGSGHCGFSFFLPWNKVASRGEISVTLQDSATGLPVGQRLVLQNPMLGAAEQRIDALERQLKILRGELQAAESRAAQHSNGQTGAELFRLVASFFGDLADGKAPSHIAGLKVQLDEAAARFPLVPLQYARDPDVTIVIVPNGRLDQLHACLDAVHRAGADRRARVLVVDDGLSGHDDAVLAPAIARNIQIARLRPVETFADLLIGITTPFAAILPADFVIGPAWLETLLEMLATDPQAALAASEISCAGQRAAARPLAVTATGDLRAADAVTGRNENSAGADAVDCLGLLLRTDTLYETGGLDPSYSSLAAQILDYCLRLRRLGFSIRYHDTPLASATTETLSLMDQSTARDIERLHALSALLARVRAVRPHREAAGDTEQAAAQRRAVPRRGKTLRPAEIGLPTTVF
jgi:hypothetical protein